MILDVISVVLLLVILGLLLFFVFFEKKHFASMEQKLAALIQQSQTDVLPPVIANFDIISNEFREYVDRESTILQDDGGKAPFVRYKTGIPNPNGNGLPPIWIYAWIPDRDVISAGISVKEASPFFQSHYQELEENKSKIEAAFSFDTIIEIAQLDGGNIHQLRVNKMGVDLPQTANRETEFRWLRENLEKLYWVLRIQDNGPGWDAW